MNRPDKEYGRDTGVHKRRLRGRKADQRVRKFRKYLIAETLEKREMLAGDTTIRLFQGQFLKPNAYDSLTVDIQSGSGTTFSQKTSGLLGILVKDSDSGRIVDPARVRLIKTANNPVRTIVANQDALNRTASLTIAQVFRGPFTIIVAPERGTSGKYEVSTFLAGDINSDGKVDKTDTQAIERGLRSRLPERWEREFDVDLDGRLTTRDLGYARKNLGVNLNVSLNNPQTLLVPDFGKPAVKVDFQLSSRSAGYRNEYGIFRVDDADGSVNGLSPGQSGYLQAALSEERRTVVFTSGQAAGALASVEMTPGSYFGTFVVVNGTLRQWLSTKQPSRPSPKNSVQVYLSSAQANNDKYPHMLMTNSMSNQLWIEDLWHGGDRDHNDMVVRVEFDSKRDLPAIRNIGLSLDPAFDSAPTGDGETSMRVVDLVGRIEMDSSRFSAEGYEVSLKAPDGKLMATSLTDVSGAFRFARVVLVPGLQTFTALVTDAQGNLRTGQTTIENCGFESDLTADGWRLEQVGGSTAARGDVSVVDGRAVLREGDSFHVNLTRSFVVPATPGMIGFEYESLQFDTSAPGFIRDAFEVALLGENGKSLMPTYTPGRDAFFNISEGVVTATGAGVTVNGQMVRIDTSSLIPGTVARLVFRLVNNDADTQSTVAIVCAQTPLPLSTTPAAAATSTAPRASGTSSPTPQPYTPGTAEALANLARSTTPGSQITPLSGPLSDDSQPGPDGSVVFTTTEDFLRGTLSNLTAVATPDELLIDIEKKRPLGTWTEIIDAGVAGSGWAGVEVDTALPQGTAVTLRVRVADEKGQLAGKPWVDVEAGAPFRGMLGRFLEIQATLRSFSALQSADIVFVVDESGSMADEQAWIGPMVMQLNTRLEEYGYQNNRYGLVGFADTPRSLPSSSSRFLSVTEFVNGAKSLSTGRSGNEDGYRGLAYALNQYEFRVDATPLVVLVTDEDRTVTDNTVNFENITNQFIDTDVRLYSILNAIMTVPSGGQVLGVDSTGLAFKVDTSGSYTIADGGTFLRSEIVSGGSDAGIKSNYIDLTWGLGSTVWDLNNLRQGGIQSSAFTAAFVDLLPLEVGNSPSVRSIEVMAIPAPSLEVHSPTTQTIVPVGQPVIISGQALAAQPILSSGARASNSIIYVTANGKPVDLLDPSGQFFFRTTIQPGINHFTFSTEDEYGRTTSIEYSLIGEQPSSTDPAFENLSEITASFRAEYARTSWFDATNLLHADVTIRNTGQYPVDAPLYVAIANLSDPLVLPQGAKGYTPDGLSYYDVSSLVAGGKLASGQQTSTLGFVFRNLNETRFTYDLKFFGLLNRAPQFTTIPVVEAATGTDYLYDSEAIDPDADSVTYTLATGPAGMSINPATGLLRWSAAEPGSYPVQISANDGRGGTTTQSFTLVVSQSLPNRPPIFTSLPVNASYIGRDYRYDSDAVDPDKDTLAYSLLVRPDGMTIDPASGMISWKPLASQKGEIKVMVQADDSRGGIATQTFTLCIVPDPDNHSPVIVSQPVTNYTLPVVKGDGFPDYVIEYFAAGSNGIKEPYGKDKTQPTTGGPFPVDPAIILGPPPPAPRVGWVATTEWLSIPMGSYVTVGFTDEVVIDGPGNDIFIRSLDPSDSAGESADIYVSTNLVDYVLLGRTPQGGNVGLDLAPLNLKDPIKAVRVVGVDIKGSSPGFDLVSIEVFPNSIGDPKGYIYPVAAIDADNDTLYYSLISGPAGMTIDANTGQVKWSPTIANVDKSYPVKVRVADSRGGMDEQSFSLLVTTGEDSISGTVKDTGLGTLNFSATGAIFLAGRDDVTIPPLGSSVASFPLGRHGFAGNGFEVEQFPVEFAVVPGQVLSFDSVGGLDFYNSTSSFATPDGYPGTASNLNGIRGISGYRGPNGAVVGVFLDDSNPKDAISPSTINFAASDVGISFLNLNPGLRQVFFIGDGLTGLGSGSRQTFIAPERTTRLFLGLADGFGFIGNPGWYEDNDGILNVTVLDGSTSAEFPSWIVFLDQNGNGRRDKDERFTTTDSSGSYSFDALTPGTYNVALESQQGWQPATGWRTITVSGNSAAIVNLSAERLDASTNRFPEIIGEAPSHAIANALFRYNIPATDPDGHSLSFELPTAPAGMIVHPSLGTIVWTPTDDQVGLHQVVLRVHDQSGGFAQQVFTVNVAAVNTAPVITSAFKPTATFGLPYQYQVRAQDAEGQAVTFALAPGAPANITIDPATGLVQFTPASSQVGSPSFKVIATDSLGAATEQTVSLSVVATSVNQPPVISGSQRKYAWLGRDYVSQILADDPNGDPLSYAVNKGPAGMAIDSHGILQWSPAGNVGDIVDVVLKVSDGRGGDVLENFAIELLSQEKNNAPVITSNPSQTATDERPYRYSPAAFDAEGDAVEWLLDKAPRGMSINPATGQIAWTPDGSHLGPQQVVLRVRDAYFAESTQSFTVMVTCNNQAPQIASRPFTETWEGSAYIYFVRADDPENDPLKFSLLASPQGMTIDATTGLIRWSPAAGTASSTARVVIAVGDGQGNQATQSFDLKVGQNQAALKNRAPVITSRPRLAGTAGQSYSYKILARDPEGDALSYSLTTSPDRMAVDAATGLLTWTPSETAIGSHVVTVSVSDALGGKATQSYILSITANQTPKISSTAITKVVATGTYAYDIQAQDPNGDALSYRLENQPSAMSIDTNGRISWPTTLADIGRVVSGVRVIVSDPAGLSDSQTFNITVETDTEAPRVSLKTTSTVVNMGSSVQIQVLATDNLKVADLTLIARQGGQDLPLALGSSGLATFDATTPGVVTFTATATDIVGNRSTQEVTLRVVDPSDVAGPNTKLGPVTQLLPGGNTRTFDPNTETVVIDYLLDITGTIDDPDNKLDNWKVIVGPYDQLDPQNLNPNDPFWRTIGTGTTEVFDGKLATLDPTVLTNNTYVVAIVSTDTNGQQTIKTFDVVVQGQAKLGQFRQEFTDLTIPLNGVPINITRTYDTQDIGKEGDFGYGWSLGMMSANIQELVPPAPTDGFFNVAAPFTTKTRVFINAPDGRRLSFKFQPRFAGGFLFFSYHVPEFVAEAGNTDYRLEVDTSGINPDAKGEWRTMLLPFAYNPDNYRLIAKDGTTYHYNQTDGLQRITDPNGNTVDFGPNSIVHSGGQRITMDRDYRGRITKITDPSGASINYSYDANGDLIKVADQAGLPTTIIYEPTVAHYVKSITDSNGKTAARMEYDASGRLTGVIDANGNRVTQSFDPGNFTQTITDGNGKPTIVSYDERGNLLRSETPTSSGTVVKIYEYKDPANPDKETRIVENGIERTFSYDAKGNKLKETTPAGTTSWTYTTLGKIGSETDPLGRITSYSYDAKGNVTETVNPLGQKSTYVYDTLGRVADFTDFNGQKTVFTDYCGCGRPETIVNPDGTTRNVNTNQFAQVTKVVDEKGNKTENVYDNVGRLVQVIDAEGRTLKYEYEGANVTKVTDGLGNVTKYAYYDNNKRKSITDAEGGVTAFTYDKNGNLDTVKDPSGNVTDFDYDEANRLVKETDPLGNFKTFKYDTKGNRVETVDRLGRRRTFDYDPMNRLTTETWWEGSVAVYTITMTYDAVGNRLTANSPDARLTWTYDTANRIATARTEYPGTALQPVTLTYSYNAMGNITEIRDNLGVSVISTYDFRNNLVTRSMSGTGVGDGAAVKMDYDTNGERRNILRFDDAARSRTAGSTDFTYFKNGLVKSIDHTSATGSLISAYGYVYDALNRLQQETHHGDTYLYGYDKTSQLISVIKNGTLTESFDFDANGNREKATGLTPGNYKIVNGNRYSSDGTYSYVYDTEGNLQKKTRLSDGQVTQYTWDFRNRLIRVEERSSGGILLKTVEYKYDALDRRIAVIINGTTTLLTTYDRDHAWADFSVTGAVEKRYLFSEKIDEIIAAWVAGQDFTWYHADKLGTIRDLSNMAGVIGQPIVYSAFGQIQSGLSGKEWNRFTFTGREWQPETGLYYYRARYYDPTSGRFISEDPIGFEANDTNKMRLVYNTAINGTDPSGKVTVIEYVIVSAWVGAHLGLAYGTVTAIYCYPSATNGQKIARILVSTITGSIFAGSLAFSFFNVAAKLGAAIIGIDSGWAGVKSDIEECIIVYVDGKGSK